MVEIKIFEQHFELSPYKVIFWKEEKAIILSDLHIGKGMHFRKEGIPIPNTLFDADLEKLNDLIHAWQPDKLIVVGDMFHAHINNEVRLFDIWRAQYPDLEIHLAKGNHDIFPEAYYKELAIKTHTMLNIGLFSFSHYPIEKEEVFSFCGHIHPGVRINGRARQTVALPCFYFTSRHCILPAFTQFSGLALLQPTKDSSVYVVLDEEVLLLR